MRHLLVAATLLFAVWQPAHAEEKKPNTLTKEEITQGWISLFDGETTFGWKIDGEASVEGGSLVLGGEKPAKAQFNSVFGPCELRLDFDSGHAPAARISFSNVTETLPSGNEKGWSHATGIVSPEGSVSLITGGGGGGGGRKATSLATTIGFDARANEKLLLRNIRVKPLGSKPIFNAKDLSGWKVIPGHKSKFSVTDKGELNIKDGNGDIQTEGQYDDFVLQLDIFSNGDHLNSGVFYRCIPGEFWSGYEAQIRNEWITDVKLKDGTTVSGSFTDKGDKVTVQACAKAGGNNWRPTREVKTIDKKDIAEVSHHRDQVVDIGTGGIYNRQPARKVVASDREWYTMTVVAHGTHMATWVNGYQVADFTDTAPIGDNARKGAKVGKGPISLQGHDPTTDLNFRNIRIAELPKGEEKK